MHTLFIYSMLIWKLFVLTWILILSLLSAILFISKIRAKYYCWIFDQWTLVDFEIFGATIKIPQQAGWLCFSCCCCCCCFSLQANIVGCIRTIWMRRDDLWLSIFTVFQLVACLFVENGCFYYCREKVMCDAKRRKIKHLIQSTYKYNLLIDDDTTL